MSRESKLDAEIMRLARMLARQHQRKYGRLMARGPNVPKFVSRFAAPALDPVDGRVRPKK